MGGTGGVHGDVGSFRLVAVGVQAAAQGAAGEDHTAHQREIPQVEAHLDHLAGGDGQLQGIGHRRFPCADGDGALAAKIDWVEFAPVEGGGFGQGDGLGAAVVVKGQPDGGAGEGHIDAITDGDVFGIPLGTVFGNGDGVAPNAGPVLIGHSDSPSVDFHLSYDKNAEIGSLFTLLFFLRLWRKTAKIVYYAILYPSKRRIPI